jgi:sugar lactone lactonase YvrE
VFDRQGLFLFKFGEYGLAAGKFAQPVDIALDPTGAIWVVESDSNRIQKFDSEGEYLLTRGGTGAGSASGQFNWPHGIDCDSVGNVYVADTQNQRFQVFSPAGTFIRSYGSLGVGDTQFSYPNDVHVDSSGNVYVADSGNCYVKKYTYDSGGGTYSFVSKIGDFADSGESVFDLGMLSYPRVVELDEATNHLLVVDNVGLRMWSGMGAPLTQYLTGGAEPDRLWSPKGVAIAPSNTVWVATAIDGSEALVKFGYTEAGQLTRELTLSSYFESTDEYFYNINDVDCDSDGNVYVLEYDQVIKLSPSGGLLGRWGSYGSADGQFNSAQGLDVYGSKVYVADSGNDRVQVFDLDGGFIEKFGEPADAPALPRQFQYISDIAVNGDSIYVLDKYDYSVKRFAIDSPHGFLDRFGGWDLLAPGSLSSPVSAALDDLGNVYVADDYRNTVEKFNPRGQFRARIGGLGTDSDEFTWPTSVAVDPSGLVFVADRDNSRLMVFSSANKTVTSCVSNVSVMTYGGAAQLSVRLRDTDGKAIVDEPLVIERSYTGSAPWTTIGTSTSGAGGVAFGLSNITRKAWYRARFAGGHLWASSATMGTAVVAPQVKSLSNPIAPKTVKKGTSFTVYGYLEPKHAAGTYSVKILTYRKVGGAYKYQGYVWAKNYTSGSKTKYLRTFALKSTGSWRLRAYVPADSMHAATYSKGYDYVTVK